MAVNDYLTLQNVKDALPDFGWVDSSSNPINKYDNDITRLITAASRAVDRFTNRNPGAYKITQDATLYFDGPGYGLYSPVYGFRSQMLSSGYTAAAALRIGELAAYPTSVAMSLDGKIDVGPNNTGGNYTALAQTDFYCEPQNAANDGHPYQSLALDILNGTYRVWYPFKRGIKIVGKFGYSTAVPDDVYQVVLEQVIRWFKLAQQNYQDHGTNMDIPVTEGYYGGERFRNIDGDLSDLVRNLRRQVI